MIGPAHVHQLLRTLAAQPVLPAMHQLPANDEGLHALLADLAGGGRSRYAAMVRHVATEAGITPEELARRAEFLLACLILPGGSSHYELLGVTPTATPEELRQRWATLIQRYHPDHFERSAGWVADQARRIIEAYQTLRDPERRRRYDEALTRERAAMIEQQRYGSRHELMRRPKPMRRRWVPSMVFVVGLAGFAGLYVWHPPQPLPQAALPPAPKLLEGEPPLALLNAVLFPSAPRPTPPAEKGPEPQATPWEMPERHRQAAPELDQRTAPMSTVQIPQEMPTHPVTRHEAALPPAITRGPRALAARDEASPDAIPMGRKKSLPRAAVQALPPAIEPAQFPREWQPPVESERSLLEEVSTITPQVGSIPPTTGSRVEPDRTARGVVPPEDDALRVIETFRAAYERKDLDALMGLFASAPREQEAVGRVAVQAQYARNFEALDEIDYELSQLETIAPAFNDSLVVRGWFRIRAIRRDHPSQLVDAAGPVRWLLHREGSILRIAEIAYELSQR